MIKARELRIGNLVKCAKHLPIGFNVPAQLVTEVLEIREGSIDTEDGLHKYRNVSPVKLTEEILLKSGGIKKEENLITFEGSGADMPAITLLSDYGIYFLVDDNNKKLSEPIEYIHHFQNLYYMLRRAEITIKWK